MQIQLMDCMLLTHMIQNTNEHDPSADVERSCLCCTCINQVIHYIIPETFGERETSDSNGSGELPKWNPQLQPIVPEPPKLNEEESSGHAENYNEIGGRIPLNDSSSSGSDSEQPPSLIPNPIIKRDPPESQPEPPTPEPPSPQPPPEPAAEENFCHCIIRNHEMERFAQVRISHLVTGVKFHLKSGKYYVVQSDLDKSTSIKLTPQDAMKKIEKYVNAKQSGKSDHQIRPCITRIEFP